MLDIEDSMLTNLESADYMGFVKLGMEFSDLVIGPEGDNSVGDLLNNKGKLEVVEAGDDISESYFNLYNELVG